MNIGSSLKSEGEVDHLVNDILKAPDFHTEDLKNFNAHQENGCLDAADKATPLEDGFQVIDIPIEVPTSRLGDPSTPQIYKVPGLHYW